jgi:uncharacterized membrane protein YfcA
MDAPLVALAAVVGLAYTVQTASGFGAMLVSVTLGAHFVPIAMLVPLVVPLSFLQCGYVAIRHHDRVRWRLLAREVLPLVGVGTVAGLVIAGHVQADELRFVLAWLVVGLAGWELTRRLVRRAAAAAAPLPLLARIPLLLGAGVMHGIYGTGGPLVVYVLGRGGHDKAALRSTLTVVWLVLNVLLITQFARTNRLSWSSAWLVPTAVVGTGLGEALHRRIDQRRFELAIFALLAVAGSALLAR